MSVEPLEGNDLAGLAHGDELPPPLFVLAPARSFTSVVCAMIGQHPQLYGLPELNLLCHETLGIRAEVAEQSPHRGLSHGLVRVVAQLYFGGQTEATVRSARRWLRERQHFTTQFLFATIADTVFPRMLVEKSPGTVSRPKCLRRMRTTFPDARFIHLVRHPRGHAESVLKAIEHRRAEGPLAPDSWLMRIATYRPRDTGDDVLLDPQHWWYDRNSTIRDFLQTVPERQWLRVRGEDVLDDPDTALHMIVEWLGVRTDALAIEEMKHPERSPYAFLGPRGAKFGNDGFFLRDPMLRPQQAKRHELDGPLRWRDDGSEFLPEVKALATELGYS